jgi:hypothetical protein
MWTHVMNAVADAIDWMGWRLVKLADSVRPAGGGGPGGVIR